MSLDTNVNSYDPNPTGIRNAVAIVVTGCFLTRLAVYYFKVINVKFRSDNESIPVEIKQDMEQPKNSNLT